MRPRHLALLCLLALTPLPAAAEPFTLSVPRLGWQIRFDGPALARYGGQFDGDDFIFQGTGLENGFNVSAFVETPRGPGATNQDVCDYYWPKAKRNPMIDPQSILISKSEKFVRVTYAMNLPPEANRPGEKPAVQANANYYFTYQGRWIDVHVSLIPSEKSPEKAFAEFEKSLVYEPASAPTTRPAAE